MREFFVCATVIAMVAAAVMAQPPFTSDSREVPRLALPVPPAYNGRAPIYVPPVVDVNDVLVTNVRPIIVEEEIWSNVVQRTVWYKKGEPTPRTNFVVLSSNLVLRSTNVMQ